MVPAGAACGALLGARIANLGRRKALILTNLLVAIGCGVTLIKQMGAICAGRFVWGFSAGVFAVIVPMFINEVSPVSYSGSLGALH